MPFAILVGGELVHERFGARPRDSTERFGHVCGGHSDAVILDDQPAGFFVQCKADARLRIIAQQRRIRDRLVAQLFAGIGRVGDKFPQEHVSVGIDRVDHHVQELGNICLEGAGFRGGNSVRCHRLLGSRVLDCGKQMDDTSLSFKRLICILCGAGRRHHAVK